MKDIDAFEQAYNNGYADAMASLVRCRDCRMYDENRESRTTFCRRELNHLYAKPDGYCSYGERRTDNERKAD